MSASALEVVRPAWPAPAGVGALMSTRRGGVSTGAWSSLNLGRSVGDAPEAVAENWRRFLANLCLAQGARGTGAAVVMPAASAAPTAPASPSLSAPHSPPVRPVWLRQVHGAAVLELTAHTPERPESPADAAWTRTPGIACIVGAADCMPVLLTTRDGRAVAAAHAGWRGLAAGVLESTVGALTAGMGVAPAELLAWMGPSIGPEHFEVGADVLTAFGATPGPADQTHFRFTPRPDGAPRWHADLRGLARERLQRMGVGFVVADEACTFSDASRFFSFRRDGGRGPTGRMAAAIWIEPKLGPSQGG